MEKGNAPLQTEELSQAFVEFIDNAQIYEDSATKKDQIVRRLSDVISEWVGFLSNQQDLGQLTADPCNRAQVKVFGGHSFNVGTRGGDMDLVAIVPNFVDRREFFGSFLDRLGKLSEVSMIRPVAEAYVPIINFHFEETEIDLCLCVVSLSSIPADLDLLDDDLLRDLDELSVRSLSGIRENTLLLSLVPNVPEFTLTLKIIKYWAKCRGIHHYPMGFLGGIAWAIMVAKIHQMYPQEDVSVLVAKFFKTYLEWPWSQPVMLRPLQQNTMKLSQWNPEVSTSDARHFMAIITPAYPEKNAAFTASTSTLSVIQTELARGLELMEKIQLGEESLQTLFESLEIETKYKHFLVVSAQARSTQHLLCWSGLVESRIRVLVQGLEKQAAVSLVHPSTVSRSSVQQCGEGEIFIRRWLLGLELSADKGAHLNLATDVKHFTDTVEKLAIERHIHKPTMTIDVRHVKRKHIADFLK